MNKAVGYVLGGLPWRLRGRRCAVVLPWVIALAASGCVVGPVYHKPETKAPAAFKNTPTPVSDPLPPPPTSLNFSNWWSIFNDAGLNTLEEQSLKASPLVETAAARVDGARAKLKQSKADQYPQFVSQDQVQIDGQTREYEIPLGSATYDYRRRGDYYNLPIASSYEVDLWGRVKHESEAAHADLEAASIDRDGVLLTLTSQVADTYFTLRSLDTEIELLTQTRNLRQEALEVTHARFRAGLGAGLDNSRAEVELASIDTDIYERNRLRGQAEDALAVLTGQSASEFRLPAATPPIKAADSSSFNALPLPPPIPTGIPADLLRRRPDLASAERTLAARTADIGVATATQYPQLSLTGEIALQSFDLPHLLDYPNHVLSGGFSIFAPLFTGGKIEANLAGSEARARVAFADYQQKVLAAYADAEDALNDLNWQAKEEEAQLRTVAAALDASNLSHDQYRAGLVNYLIVTDADRSLISAERGVTQSTAARYKATIRLIKAIGGGWQAPAVNSSTPPSSAKNTAAKPVSTQAPAASQAAGSPP